MSSKKFNHTIATLNREIARLYEQGDQLVEVGLFERSVLYEKVLELRAAIRLLEGYVFKESE